MAFFACGTRDRPFPYLRLPPPLTRCGLSGLMRNCARLMADAWPVMHIAENASQNSHPEWDAVSACGSVGKLHPTPIANSGSHFPPEPSTGNCIPFQRQILGRIFRKPAHPETVPHSEYIQRTLATVAPTSVKKKASGISRLSHLYCFARNTTNDEVTRPARPSWQLQPCCPDLPWWGDPLRRPSYRAAS